MARALYIHWPFCLAKCPYCDFNSHVREKVEADRWEAALLADMRHEAAHAGGEKLHSIFFGGGTPSLMPPALVERLLREADKLWGLEDACEITLEANPSSVEAANFAALAGSGVNRVSLGVQSLRDEALRFLGRLHDVNEALRAVETAQGQFARVSMDLIYARPEQTIAEWETELGEALAIGTDHLSLYQLTIEPGTRFATDVRRDVFAPLDDDPAADLFAVTAEMTSAAEIPAYEISNHSRVGQESRHNLTYWRYQDYAGIGPGAHGRRGGKATMRHRKPENYLAAIAKAGHALSEERPLGVREQASEALLMGLRLVEGINLADLESRFGIESKSLIDRQKLDLHRDIGLIKKSGSNIAVTPAGMPLLDAILGDLVPAQLVEA